MIRSIVPTFVVADVANTARWYVEQLGFSIAGSFPDAEPWSYASLMLGSAELMLLQSGGDANPRSGARRPEGAWDAYVRMDGVRELYDRLRDRALMHAPLRKQRYGDWEFEVRDPNGYILVFGGDPGSPE